METTLTECIVDMMRSIVTRSEYLRIYLQIIRMPLDTLPEYHISYV